MGMLGMACTHSSQRWLRWPRATVGGVMPREIQVATAAEFVPEVVRGVDPAHRRPRRILRLRRCVVVEREGTVFVREHRAGGRTDDGRVR
jgi:hypothetical protein